ncbi:hypothetical protein ScalyP_jg10766 [Parmales sp. scaly parma]|nr:hypothetical protein ScalyP_jg10766 [Parmales sp. scaly parma]
MLNIKFINPDQETILSSTGWVFSNNSRGSALIEGKLAFDIAAHHDDAESESITLTVPEEFLPSFDEAMCKALKRASQIPIDDDLLLPIGCDTEEFVLISRYFGIPVVVDKIVLNPDWSLADQAEQLNFVNDVCTVEQSVEWFKTYVLKHLAEKKSFETLHIIAFHPGDMAKSLPGCKGIFVCEYMAREQVTRPPYTASQAQQKSAFWMRNEAFQQQFTEGVNAVGFDAVWTNKRCKIGEEFREEAYGEIGVYAMRDVVSITLKSKLERKRLHAEIN